MMMTDTDLNVEQRMKIVEHTFSDKTTSYYFDVDFSYLENMVTKHNTVLITDEHILHHHQEKFAGWKTIVIQSGEAFKKQAAVDRIIDQLIGFEADRTSCIVGIGGGVVTDIAGYTAGIYMRGIRCGLVPTTILAMVDASIGGKNGVDVGAYKNLVGLIRQPDFLLYDYSFLNSLPENEWVNGFAEIIKHASIKDAEMFNLLETEDLAAFRNSRAKIADLIEQNVQLKTSVVLNDEFERGERKLLNFGHTLGHAIENIYSLPHGHAVSIGMAAAATISEKLNGFSQAEKLRLIEVLSKYQLPVTIQFDEQKIFEMLKLDKKRSTNEIGFILLNSIGDAIVKSIPLIQLQDLLSPSLLSNTGVN
ncbi:MAG: 3-dehydroquinate synthase [Ferruginibacter sp.]|nr:3-dehydroquinate synthase [Ferruginibacter sp.]